MSPAEKPGKKLIDATKNSLAQVERTPLIKFALIALVLPGLLSPAPDPTERVETHCVVVVLDQLESGEFVVSDPVCFPTLSEVDAWVDSTEASSLAGIGWLEESGGGPFAMASTFTLGRHFDDFNGNGSSISVVGTACTGGWWNTGTAWANRISSSYNGCARLRHWDLPNRMGLFEDTTGAGTTKNLSYMNKRADSVSYHAS